ncbi:TIGR02808 family protein [Colwellia sp. C1TZA3]|uniref:TIGR02808 family protein n=1 Tax=Colwellia sp. C1TZA3 TaxID=2508879 RepID=UPI0011BA26D1|nr:TIGR02808 family protein [Colwellia sp. C1TZA3]TWX73436.1 TIGR02808 family protein [Colwellia sp. C1TZA3]
MSDLEQLIWNVLGYTSMPFIFLFGFIATALGAVVILKIFGAKPTPAHKNKANEKL